MNKENIFAIDEDELETSFDFGFFATTSEEINHTKLEQCDEVVKKYEQIIKKLLKAIDPFLNNLGKDSDNKEYIYWPNRKEKIEEFRKKLRKIATVEVTR